MRQLHPSISEALEIRERCQDGFTWEVLKGGSDARLLFGKMRGQLVSDLVTHPVGRAYLGKVYSVLPGRLKEIVEGYFE